MNRPLLSITIPTWNRAPILEIALSQLLPQLIEFKDSIELIISDNCSTDNTSEVINKFKLKFFKLCLLVGVGGTITLTAPAPVPAMGPTNIYTKS